jgi:aminoglycoside 6'-N-acetyltransferase I
MTPEAQTTTRRLAMSVPIYPLTAQDAAAIAQCASLLTAHFPQAEDWQSQEGALAEVREIIDEGVAFVALDGDAVIGWIGGLPEYNGHTWELHPLVVDPAHRGWGVGRALVAHLEEAALREGVGTIMLGTDDEDGRTTLSRVDDLYADLSGHIARLDNLDPANPHPFSFYRRCGYAVVGVLPDANGPGRPDIFMAKRLR